MASEKGSDVFEYLKEEIRFFREGTIDLQSEEGKEKYTRIQSRLEELNAEKLETQNMPEEAVYWWGKTIQSVPYEEFVRGYSVPLVVSLTSYPARIHYVSTVVESILSQTRKPDLLVLWLAENQFLNREEDLPAELRDLIGKNQLQVRWCRDLKPHKKYYYAFQEYPDANVITVDDDLIYQNDTIELLQLSSIRHPKAVSAMRVHLMAVTGDGEILPYRLWVKETYAQPDTPNMQLTATGSGGILYPAGWYPEKLFDEKGISETCLNADDLWLKAWEMIQGYPVVLACKGRGIRVIPGSQESALWNMNQEENDSQFSRIIQYIKQKYDRTVMECCEKGGEDRAKESLVRLYYEHASSKMEIQARRISQLSRRNEKDQKEIQELKNKFGAEREKNKELSNEIQQLKKELEECRKSLAKKLREKILHYCYKIKKKV